MTSISVKVPVLIAIAFDQTSPHSAVSSTDVYPLVKVSYLSIGDVGHLYLSHSVRLLVL